MTPPDIRWKQRYGVFKNVFRQFENAILLNPQNRLMQDGLIFRFRYTFELGWKCLQDILIDRGYEFARGPKPTIEQAFQDGIIPDGVIWLQMLKARNEASHLYDEAVFHELYHKIKNEFITPLKTLQDTLDKL